MCSSDLLLGNNPGDPVVPDPPGYCRADQEEARDRLFYPGRAPVQSPVYDYRCGEDGAGNDGEAGGGDSAGPVRIVADNLGHGKGENHFFCKIKSCL